MSTKDAELALLLLEELEIEAKDIREAKERNRRESAELMNRERQYGVDHDAAVARLLIAIGLSIDDLPSQRTIDEVEKTLPRTKGTPQ